MYSPSTTKASFVVDPQRDGIDNALWFEVDPTIAINAGKFRFNAAEGLVRSDSKFGRFEFAVTYPTTTGQDSSDLVADVEFGLKNLSLGNIGKISVLADQSAGTMVFTTYDIYGEDEAKTIVWQDEWNSAVTRFIIEWFNDRVRLIVLNTGSASKADEIVLAEHKVAVGQYPLNPFIKATGADNFDVDYIVVDNVHQNSIMLI